jgi:hypothetical protein
MSKIKRGRIGRNEDKQIQEFLAKHPENPSMRLLAQLLRRDIKQITVYCAKFFGKGESTLPEDALESAVFVREFRSRSEWKIMKTQFTSEELDYYEELYVKFMKQFHEDIEPTEEFQIFALIEKIIFINRYKKQAMEIQSQILEINREILELQLKELEDPDIRKQIAALQNKLQNFSASEKQRTETYTMMEKEKTKILEGLKGTRSDRIKNAQTRETYLDMIKMAMDKKARMREGRRATIYKMATDQAEMALREPHQYLDGQWDQPMLIPEDVRISKNGPMEISQQGDSI